MDEDGSGVLEPHEVKALCSQLHDLVPLELSAAEMASAVRRLDRDSDGEVNFAEFFAWYEQEMTEAKMRDRPLYSEVKEMFTDMDADGSGELDIGAIYISSTAEVCGAASWVTRAYVDFDSLLDVLVGPEQVR